MPAQPKKPRIIYLMRILYQETDPTHGLSLPEIQARLEDYGIGSERKALYRDLAALEEFGFAVGKMRTRPVRYYFAERLFDRPELLLLVDAVQSSRSITEANSEELIAKLKRLISIYDAQDVQSQLHVSGRVKMQNESVFETLDQIQRAIAERRDISFAYMRHDADMRLVPTEADGAATRVKTPLFLMYTNEKYYVAVYDERTHDHVRIYRVDRMHNVLLLDASAASHRLGPDFDIAKYERRTPGMFDMEPVRVTLLVAENVVSNIIDLFGVEETTSVRTGTPKDADDAIQDGPWAQMTVRVAPSPVFFGQIAQFGGAVRIVGPKKVAQGFKDHLRRALDAQGT